MLVLGLAKKGKNLVLDIFKEQEKKWMEFSYIPVFMFGTPSIFASWKSTNRMDHLTKRAKKYAHMQKNVHQLGAAKDK